MATIIPVALPIIPSSGPASWRASSGSASASEPPARSASGVTRTFHTSYVPTSHSALLHAAVRSTPEGKPVASSSQWSARRTASATASAACAFGVGSGVCAAMRRAVSSAKSQFTGPSLSDWFIIAWIWPSSWFRSGIPAPPAASALRRRTP